MAKKTVLAIGIDPSFADFAARNSRPTFRHLGKDIPVSRQCAEREIAPAA
jgi:hypothetical protein